MERIFRKSVKLKPCKLDGTELIELVDIIKTGFDNMVELRIFADWNDVHVRGQDIEEMLNNKELPNRLTSLSIYADGLKDKIRYSLRLSFYHFSSELEVSSPDQLWLLGIAAQVKEFLRTKKTWYWWLPIVFPILTPTVIIFAVSMITVFVKLGKILLSLSAGAFTITLILAYYFQYKGTFLPYTQIIVRKSNNLLNKENINILIAILSLIAAIIEIIK